MVKLNISGSSDCPEMIMDHEEGIIYIGGNSLPENVNEVYQPALNWIEAYIQKPNPKTKIEFHFEYFNTATSHMLMRIIEKCMVLYDKCEEFTFNWRYNSGDVDMREFGDEINEIFKIPVNIISTDIEN